MKKTAIASVALAAALFAVSCQKENTPVQNEPGPMTISAVSEGLNSPTKTELAFKYDVLWSTSDKIYVKDASGNYDTFQLETGAGTTEGTFTQEGQVSFTGEVQAYYPATMLESGSPLWPASQTNDQTIPMYCKKTLSGTTDETMDFASLGSMLQIVFNTTQADIILESIEVKDGSKTMSGAFHVDENGMAVIDATDKAGITLDLGTGKALGKGANYFNIAVPAGNYQDLTLVFTATDGTKCKMTKGKVNIACNTVGRLTLTGENFKIYIPEGALAGEFSVSGTKKVRFSQGNLWADGSNALHFESNQYSSASSWDASHVSHFTWSSTVEAAVGDSNSGDYLFCDESHKVSVDGGDAIYYALSNDEWKYLFNTRTMTYNKSRYSNAMSGVTIGSATYKGVFLYPDNYNGEVVSSGSMTWDQINAAGIVFLPAAAFRQGYVVRPVAGGGYWSSTAYNDSEAYRGAVIDNNNVTPNIQASRNRGFSVRLITESK